MFETVYYTGEAGSPGPANKHPGRSHWRVHECHHHDNIAKPLGTRKLKKNNAIFNGHLEQTKPENFTSIIISFANRTYINITLVEIKCIIWRSNAEHSKNIIICAMVYVEVPLKLICIGECCKQTQIQLFFFLTACAEVHNWTSV